MNFNFFEDKNYFYTEVGTIMEDCKNKAKVYIDILSPGINGGKAFFTVYNKRSTARILNKRARESIGKYALTNYLEMQVPKSVLLDAGGSLKKGDKVLITFVGGEINKPRITGYYEE